MTDKKWIELVIVSAIVAVAAVAPLHAKPAKPAKPAGPQLGKPAPNFTLPDHTGKPVSLADYKGKVVVLEWVNPDCPF